MLTRRAVFLGAAGLVGAGALGYAGTRRPALAATEGDFEIVRTAAEWQEILTPEQYSVLREEATERAFTSPLLNEKRAGLYHCVGCDAALFDSATKFDSGTGWPSFWDALPGAIGYKEDRTLWIVRTEEHCARCGGHMGHVFDDGPPRAVPVRRPRPAGR
jgi:peptide-methionine (R)-S-oxide reductase